MKPFEEKYTLWLDGKLTGRELEAFEAELGEWKANAGLEKTEVAKIGGLLRAHLKAPPLGNEDFFNHQILQQIAAEQPKPTPATTHAVAPARRTPASSSDPAPRSGTVSSPPAA